MQLHAQHMEDVATKRRENKGSGSSEVRIGTKAENGVLVNGLYLKF